MDDLRRLLPPTWLDQEGGKEVSVFGTFVLNGTFSVKCTECPFGEDYDTEEGLEMTPTAAEIISMIGKHYIMFHMDSVQHAEGEDSQTDPGPAESDPATDPSSRETAQDHSDEV